MNFEKPLYFLIVLLLFIFSSAAFAQQQAAETTKVNDAVGILTTEFTYQGKLTDTGAAANGNYDFEFKLTDTNGNLLGTLQRTSVTVKNGIFTVRLDFGFTPFNDLNNKFLEIGVRKLASGQFETLAPRQPITATPISIVSSSALNANFASYSFDSQKLGGVESGQYVLTGDSRMSDAREPTPGSANYIQNSLDEQAASFTINGVGSAGILKAVNVNALLQYSLNGAKFITAPGTNNTFLGVGSAANWATGTNNSFFGKNTGQQTTTGSYNSFFGASAGMENTTGQGNSFFGADSGKANTQGNQNSFFGISSGQENTTGNYNSFFGNASGLSNTTGKFNSFFGASAGLANTTGEENSFFGTDAGFSNTTGKQNSFFGIFAGFGNTTGNVNSFFGGYAGRNNSTGFSNSFFGYEAGNSNSQGFSNSFFGVQAGKSNQTGNRNTFLGTNAGNDNTDGSDNVFVGMVTGFQNTTGNRNTFLGMNAGGQSTTGSNNTFVGYAGGLANKTGTRNTTLGYGADFAPGGNLTYATAIGADAVVQTSNTVLLGRITGEDTVQIPGRLKLETLGTAGGSALCLNGSNLLALCSSSIRYKTDVRDFTSGLELIRRLRPVSFTWKDGGRRDLGFVAEEVASVEPLLTVYNEKGEVEGVKYDRVSAALVNAVGEQQAQIENQQEQIKNQQTQIEDQARRLMLQQEQLEALRKLVCSQNTQAEVCREKEPKK